MARVLQHRSNAKVPTHLPQTAQSCGLWLSSISLPKIFHVLEHTDTGTLSVGGRSFKKTAHFEPSTRWRIQLVPRFR